jgi:FAD/FMN-containing dehydrogenase
MTIENLKSQISGKVILPSDANYDEMRQVFMGSIDRKPAVIVCVANEKDVVTVIEYAKENNLPLAVRSGGHSNAGHCTVDDGVVLDLRDMNAIEVDAQTQTAWVQSGATAEQVTKHLDAQNFVVGFGDTGSVGVGGITTGGGIGYLVRKFGMTIDNVLAAEIVTAEGKMLTVDDHNHPDLFWAIRGGGGNFGVVTRFKYRLHPLTQVYGGVMILPATPAVIAGCIQMAFKASEEFSAIFNIMPAPPMPFLPPELHGKPAVMALMMYAGDPAAGEKEIAALRSLAKPLADMVRPMRYREIFFPEDKSYRPLALSKNMFMKSVDENLAQTILDQLNKSDAAMRAVQLRVLGGAMAKVPADATAYAHRTTPIMTNVATFYTGPDDYKKREDWLHEMVNLLDQGEHGTYVGFLGDDGEAGVHLAYPDKTLQRLREIKKQYDPTNFFHLNQNITPAN